MTETKEKQTTLTGEQVLSEKIHLGGTEEKTLEDLIIFQLKSSMIKNHLFSKKEVK